MTALTAGQLRGHRGQKERSKQLPRRGTCHSFLNRPFSFMRIRRE
jgi:hypothetical protein